MGARSNYLADLANENSSLTIQLQFEEKTNMAVQHISTPYPLWHPVRQFAGKQDEGKVLEFSKAITALLLYILPFAIDELTRPLCDTKTNLYP